jgi:hypothetical protein
MPATASIDTASDLLAYLDGKDALAYRYVQLLARCADGGYPVGMMDEAVQAEAVSDWEAAACITEGRGKDIRVEDITEARQTLNRASPLVQEHGHRKGKTTYRLHPELTETDE